MEINEDKETMMKNSKLKYKREEFLGGILLSFAACFMLFLYAPLELYFTNKEEFWFDFWLLFPAMFVVFIFFFLISILLLYFILIKSHKTYYIMIISYFIAYVCTYIQGNYLIENLPPLDGTWIIWSQYPGERVKSIVLWTIGIAFVLVIVKYIRIDKFYRLVKYLCVFMFAVQIVTLVSIGIMNGGFEKKLKLTASNKEMFEMSEQNNFIILMIDTVDASVWEDVSKKYPEYQTMLEDFTYYDNVLGAYSYTTEAIPFILTGEWYECDESFKEYSTNAIMSSPLFMELTENSYKMDLYTQDVILDSEKFYMFDNVVSYAYGPTSYWDFIRWNIMMTGFKYAPFDLKRICFVNPSAFKHLRKLSTEEFEVYSDSNKDVYDSIINNDIYLTADKCFKFIHLGGGHVPFQYDASVNIVAEEDGTYEGNLEASMTVIKAYLEKLKENHVYDNSVIVIMADHGFCGEGLANTLYRQNPILLVKGVGEKHDFLISNAPISHEDLQEAFGRLLNGQDSMSVFDYKEGEERKRRYLYREYNQDIYYEYIQTGEARERDTLNPTGQRYMLK